MTKSDIRPLVSWSDVPAAIGLLTRLPVRVDMEQAGLRGAHGAWAYPIVGLLAGGLTALIGTALIYLGVPADIAAAIALAVYVIITGAMHEDGLADTADGLWGGWEAARRLDIMKDSHIGAYGVIAIAVALLIRWLLLSYLLGSFLGGCAIVLAAIISRSAMVAVMSWQPHARTTGLSQSVGRPPRMTALIAAGIAAVGAMAFGLWVAVLLGVVIAAITWACGRIAQAKIGGQTGDILGATQQITEIAAGVVLVSCLAV